MSKWDELTMAEKAEMIGVAVRNGITNLQDIRDKYNEFAEGGSKGEEEEVNTDEQYLNTMERVAQDNYQKWGFSNPDEALLHALNDNTYNYRRYYGKYPQSRANADTHWTDEFKTVWHPTFSNESIYSSQKSQYNPLGLPGGFWSGDTFIPMAWQLDANEYKKGGSIHIKPSHRGRLTELKKRTGKTEAELYRTGSPATRKMITFARNARKWKHGLGGNLFSGEEEGSQQMNIFRRPSGEYFYHASPDSKEIAVTPIMTTLGDESMWTYQDENGRRYTPRLSSNEGTVTLGETPSTWENIIATSNNNYMDPVLGAPARWKASWDNNTNAIRALWDNPAITGHPLGMAAKAVEHLAGDEGLSKTLRLYQNSDGSDNARWLWQRSLTGDALTSLGLFPATAQGILLGNRAIQEGKRLVQNIGDRYQGMEDAAEYAANKVIKSSNAMDATNYIWKNRQGPQASGIIAPYKDRAAFIKKTDGTATAVATQGGNQTINLHLGGAHYGDRPWELYPMTNTERRWLGEFVETAPQGTILGEMGRTRNFAEQYAGVTPSWRKAIKDALLDRKVDNPYWGDFEKSVNARIATDKDPELLEYYKDILNGNNPLSTDSYSMMLSMARKGKYNLRYDSTPMGLFNALGVREREFYNSLSNLSAKEKVEAINEWLAKFNPEARPAYLKDGEILIPRPLLKKKTPSKSTWLKK